MAASLLDSSLDWLDSQVWDAGSSDTLDTERNEPFETMDWAMLDPLPELCAISPNDNTAVHASADVTGGHICANVLCMTTSSTLWRHWEYGWLCNACAQYLQRNRCHRPSEMTHERKKRVSGLAKKCSNCGSTRPDVWRAKGAIGMLCPTCRSYHRRNGAHRPQHLVHRISKRSMARSTKATDEHTSQFTQICQLRPTRTLW
jgi:hypothetical protein